MAEILKAPFPWFGGKSRVADAVWERFGNVPNYVEPFAGSLAVLLGRPTAPRIETVNDKDAYLANFWRAVQSDPEGVARYADWPVNETDLYARHAWLVTHGPGLRVRLEVDPDAYDIRMAGWWVWGICCWIGSGWCAVGEQWRKRPDLGNIGRGVHRQKPHLGDHGKGVNRPGQNLAPMMMALADRLRLVRVTCGDWTRVLCPSATYKCGGVSNRVTGVLLDPPYGKKTGRKAGLYAQDCGNVADEVRDWALKHGANRQLRIALCGYAGEHDELEAHGWESVAWTAPGGYGVEGKGDDNRKRERIWFSPYCVRLQPGLFDVLMAGGA